MPALAPEVQRAIDRCTVAASRATSTFAHADAAHHLSQAIRHVSNAGHAGTTTHFELLHALGRAHWRAGQREEAAATFEDAWLVAQILDDPERAARAAVGAGFSCDFSGDAALARAARCRGALDRLPECASATRARLLSNLASSMMVQPDARPARAVAAEALAMARGVGDPVALGYALVAVQFTDQDPARLSGRLADAREILSLAATTGEHALEILGRFGLIGALLEAGDPSLDAEIDAQAEAVRRLNEPRYRRHHIWFECMRLLLRGRLGQAERSARLGLDVALADGDPDALDVYGGQIAVARWMQGRSTENTGMYEAMRARFPTMPLWTAVLASAHATSASASAAAAVPLLDEFQLEAVPGDQYTLLTLAAAADAACVLGDARLLGPLHESLAPYADRMTPIAMGVACWGPIARPLGLLDLALGDVDAGIGHLEVALQRAEELDARPFVAESSLDLAAAHIRYDRSSASTAALIDRGESLAATIGMPSLVARAAALRGPG